MNKEKQIKIIYLLGILLFILFAFYAYSSNVKEYINDSIILIILLTTLYFLRKQFTLSPTIFIILILAMASHDAGVFGFYSNSPIPIQYDHFTHFIGMFAVSLLIFNLFKKYFSSSKLNNVLILIMVILASLGIGSLIESIEYLGFLKFGTGPGLLKFGGLGDTITEETLRDIDLIGGGWINTMEDLIYNFLGAFLGTILMYVLNKNASKSKTM